MPTKLIYEDLSYKIIGALFHVFNTIGWRYNEKIIQKAIADELAKLNINYQREFYVAIKYQGKKIGHHYFDFIIENQIVLEIKRGRHLLSKDFNQIKSYLKTSKLKLGILALFTSLKVKIARIANIY
ncbi:GxxExxY protein [Candidatus Falkowbacteria bacterium]|nr:GxxExxY protein [Candidatus Falkowbacteria bacterium]